MTTPLIPGQAVRPLQIHGTPTTSGTVDEPIDPFTVTATGGTTPYAFGLIGDYPDGASVTSPGGVVTPGTSATETDYTGLSVRVTDARGRTADLATFDIDVSAGGAYTTGAVSFDGATGLACASLACTDNQYFSFSCWIYLTDLSVYPTVYESNAGGSPTNNTFYLDAAGNAVFNNEGVPDVWDNSGTAGDVSTGEWVNFIGTVKTQPGGGKIIFVLKSGVDITSNVSGDPANGFTMPINGLPFDVGDDGFEDYYVGYMADVWIAPGQSLLTGSTISAPTIAKFIDGDGKPVDLGADGSLPTGTAPAIFLHIDAAGDPADFGDNLGTGGAFSLNAGTTTTGALVNTVADVIVSDTTGITVGAFITATGVTAGTTVSAVDTMTMTVTMSAAATATNPTASMQFGGVLRLAPSSPSD